MYTLLSGLYKYLTRKEEYCVLVLGLDNAGKTTLLERIKALFNGTVPPSKTEPTIGLNIGRINLSGNRRLKFWDLGGQTDLQSIWESYYASCNGIVFMVDSTDRERIEEVKSVFDKLISNDEVEGVPVLMLANKQDMPNALRIEEIKEIFNQIAVKLSARDSKVMPAVALKGEGVKEAVEWLETRLVRNSNNRPPVLSN